MRKPLTKLSRAIEEFRKLDPEMQAQAMVTLLYIAEHEGEMVIGDLQDAVGYAVGSSSRNASRFKEIDRHGNKGHGLVHAEEDPHDRRRKVLWLTPKGKQMVQRLRDILK